MLSLLPFFIFLSVFLGSGIYFHHQGVEFAFYQISPAVAILPAIIIGYLLAKGAKLKKVESIVNGIRNKDIILMCIIFILAGAFGEVTKAIGAVQSTVDFALHYVPKSALLAGLFLISAFVSTAMGTSMGVVAAITPIALGLSQEAELPKYLSVATVVGGAMFGDNLSMISDTTIAAVSSQDTNLKDKFKLNAPIALVSGIIMIIILVLSSEGSSSITLKDYSLLKVFPYVLIIALSLIGIHVFHVLIIGIVVTGIIGICYGEYSVIKFAKDIYTGFASMNEIMILSLLVGGLSNLIKDQGGLDYITSKIKNMIGKSKNSKVAEIMIAAIASLNDIVIANNTIAIILGGSVAKRIAKDFKIPAYRSACWLDIFSCVFQGILPYSAQILLAASIAKLSPVELVTKVYYCPILGAVAILYIIFSKRLSC